MSFTSFVFFLALVWLLIHGFNHVSKRSRPLLPSYPGAMRRRAAFWNMTHCKVTVSALHLRITTSAFNAYHDLLADKFTGNRYPRLTTLSRLFYDLGGVMGVLGMCGALAALAWMTGCSVWSVARKFLASSVDNASLEPHILSRRGLSEGNTKLQQTSSSYPVITPIIPGVTVPLDHLPLILLAIFLSQVIHELGHAIAAALESLPAVAAGVSFIVCIPAAFVTFPSEGLQVLSPRARTRIIAAGPFHNLVFWCILVLLGRVGAGSLAWSVMGYDNVGDAGNVVLDVDAGSPLYGHLLPGAIITKLDDTNLGTSNLSQDIWTTYLTSPEIRPTLGWCIDGKLLEGTDACCSPSVGSMSTSLLSCFTGARFSKDVQGCLDPIPILTGRNETTRCTRECGSGMVCVEAGPETQLLRLTVVYPSKEEAVVLWSGPRSEVWAEVTVGTWIPRFRVLPRSMPWIWETFWNYLSMATLSLYLFNLLPIQHLDGSKLLTSLLDMTMGVDDDHFLFDIEGLEISNRQVNIGRNRRRTKERMEKHIPLWTMALLVICVLLAILNGF